MGDYSFRVFNAFLGSELIPATVRTRLMRLAGFDLAKNACVWAGANFRSNKVTLGNAVFINVGFYHDGHQRLTVGDKVRIGPFVRILTATHEIGPSHQRALREVVGQPVHIEERCWVGAGVMILPGVTVKAGCVLAANAVLYDSTEENGLYAGNPARRVRDLDP